jgi:hypothetical protein
MGATGDEDEEERMETCPHLTWGAIGKQCYDTGKREGYIFVLPLPVSDGVGQLFIFIFSPPPPAFTCTNY